MRRRSRSAKTHALLSLALLCFPLLLAGCGGDKTTKIATVLPLSGPWSIYGQPIRQGIELAHGELVAEHEAGEYSQRLLLEVHDSESEPTRAAALLEEAFAADTEAVIGGVTSAEALEMIKVADEAERVLLSPSASSPILSGESRYFFRIFPSDFREGTKMGSFAALKLDLGSVVVLTANSPFARGISRVFQDEFERYDGEVLGEMVYPDDATDFSEPVAEALALQPEAVFIADFADEVRQILTELEDRGYEGKRLTTSAFASPETIDSAGELANGVVLAHTMFDVDSDDPQIEAFVAAYQEAYDEPPGLFAAHGYDAMKVIAAGLERSRTPSDLWQALRSLSSFQGLTGQIQFDEKGDVGKFPRVYVLEEGKLTDYDQLLEEQRQQIQERRQQLFQDLERLRREGKGLEGGQGP